jgi:hypothetical protein
MPIRTLPPRMSVTVTTTSSPMTICSPIFLLRTNIAGPPCSCSAGTPGVVVYYADLGVVVNADYFQVVSLAGRGVAASG